MGDVIQIKTSHNKGNGAREAIQKYFKVKKSEMEAVDHFLAWLWHRGFVVAEIEPDGGPKRKNPLEAMWENALPEFQKRHHAAIKKLGRTKAKSR